MRAPISSATRGGLFGLNVKRSAHFSLDRPSDLVESVVARACTLARTHARGSIASQSSSSWRVWPKSRATCGPVASAATKIVASRS